MADVVKRVKQIMNIDWFEKVTDEDFIKDLVNDIRQDGAEKAEAELEAVKGRNKELQEEVEEYVFEDFYEHAYQRKSDGLYYTGGLSNNETTYYWLCKNGYMKEREDGLYELTDKKRGGE